MRLGVGICYDLRFPEMAQLYAQRGMQLLVYPGGGGGYTYICNYVYVYT